MQVKRLHTPLTAEQLDKLNVKDYVLFTGELYTMRDQAHKRLFELYTKAKKMPVDVRNAVIYYCGPTPAQPSRVIGSCGPTSSERMDEYTSFMLDRGAKVFIGKGERKPELVQYFHTKKAVYLLAIGGAGSYYSRRVLKQEPVYFQELGPEAVCKLTVKDFPAIVGIDSHGKYIYPFGRKPRR